jgi:hypothetical protein
MSCPMCYDDVTKEYIGKVTDYKYVKSFLLPWEIRKHSVYITNWMDKIVELGDIHDPKAWKMFAKIQRDLMNELNLGAAEMKN